MRRMVVVAVLLVFSMAGALQAQSTNASLTGYITDPSKAVIVDAKVLVINVGTNLRYEGVTDKTGSYYVTNLSPGIYRIEVEKQSFKTVIKSDIVLHVQDTIAINFEMALGSVTETVTVQGGAPLINTESGTVSTVVDRKFVENMPLNGRSFQTLIMLAPGVVLTPATLSDQGQFSVNGQRADANYLTVDGASANIGASIGSPLQTFAGAVPGTSVQGGTNSLVSVDAMQEFRIQTSSFSPEFGRTPGGQVSIVTRSGTNQFHGTLFEYLRNDVFDANNWFANHAGQKRPPERQNDFGGVFGGPIIKDRTFFFFSYEGLRLRLPLSAATVVPSTASANPALNRQVAVTRMQPLLNAFPVPNGPDLGSGFAQFNASYSDPSSVNATSIRVDHAVNSKITLFGRYNYAPSQSVVRQGVASNIEAIQVNTQTFTLGVTQALSVQVSNELRANYSNVKSATSFGLDTFGGAAPLPASAEAAIFPSGFSSSNSLLSFIILGASNYFVGKNLANEQRQVNFVDNLSLSRSTHQVKLGVDYRWLAPFSSPRPFSEFAFFIGMSGAAGALGGVAPGAGISSTQGIALLARNISLYGQDTWRVTPRLTLTYGIRWDVNPALQGKNSVDQPFVVRDTAVPATMTLAPQGSSLYATTYGNIAPRIGFAYQVRERQRAETVLRGGFGVFYDLGVGQLGNVTGNWPGQRSASFSNVPFPLTPQQETPPAFSQTPPVTGNFFAADPNLKLPRTYQWNVALEQSLGANQTITLTDVGAVGRKLLRNDTFLTPNATFSGTVFLTKNTGTSDYHSLQAQFRRRLSGGVQALASYTWSHSIDTASSDSANSLLSSTISDVRVDRGSSDFDIRHSFTGALTYDLPVPWKQNGIVRAIMGNWSVDNLVLARSAPPVNVVGAIFTVGSARFQSRPNLVPGIPLYLFGSQYAGGRILNNTAGQGGAGCKGPFCPAPAGTEGNLGRNALRAFGAWQTNFAVRRQFHITEHVNLQFRAEFFNLTNHPNFGAPTASLSSPLFGQSTQMLSTSLGSGGATGGFSPLYQIGGPRSIQLAMKLLF